MDHDYYENQYNQMCRTSFNWLINVHMKKYAPFGIYKLRTMLRQVRLKNQFQCFKFFAYLFLTCNQNTTKQKKEIIYCLYVYG